MKYQIVENLDGERALIQFSRASGVPYEIQRFYDLDHKEFVEHEVWYYGKNRFISEAFNLVTSKTHYKVIAEYED